MYTGTLIDDLIATVQRAEREMQVAQVPERVANEIPASLLNEAWLAAVEETPSYDSKLLGVA